MDVHAVPPGGIGMGDEARPMLERFIEIESPKKGGRGSSKFEVRRAKSSQGKLWIHHQDTKRTKQRQDYPRHGTA